jgi:hypothetical protein
MIIDTRIYAYIDLNNFRRKTLFDYELNSYSYSQLVAA